jgi:3-ketosteroid 9alpha-monooxygenase subunit B
MARYHKLTVADAIQETADAHSILFDIPATLNDKFCYQSGQFITLKFPCKDEHLQRCYSMSSTPNLDRQLRVTVKRVEGGRGSNWICDNLKAGSKIDVMQPAGLFVTRNLSEDHLLCAGGSGITPVLSILRHVLSNGTGKVRLIYANRDEASVIFKQTIKALGQEYVERLEVIHLLDSLQGIPSLGLLVSLAQEMHHGRAFICGPGPFMDAMASALKQADMPEDRIHIERFVLAKPSADKDESASQSQSNEDDIANEQEELPASTVQLEIDGVHYVIACEAGQTVLEAAEKIGIELPYSCREGICASCICEVIEGSVKLNNNEVLDDKDLANNLTLGCQAVPMTAELKLKYT